MEASGKPPALPGKDVSARHLRRYRAMDEFAPRDHQSICLPKREIGAAAEQMLREAPSRNRPGGTGTVVLKNARASARNGGAGLICQRARVAQGLRSGKQAWRDDRRTCGMGRSSIASVPAHEIG